MKETYLVAIYVPEKLLDIPSNREHIIREFDRAKKFHKEVNLIHYLFPTLSKEWKIECVNPKLISEDEFKKVQLILDETQKRVDEWLNKLKK